MGHLHHLMAVIVTDTVYLWTAFLNIFTDTQHWMPLIAFFETKQTTIDLNSKFTIQESHLFFLDTLTGIFLQN